MVGNCCISIQVSTVDQPFFETEKQSHRMDAFFPGTAQLAQTSSHVYSTDFLERCSSTDLINNTCRALALVWDTYFRMCLISWKWQPERVRTERSGWESLSWQTVRTARKNQQNDQDTVGNRAANFSPIEHHGIAHDHQFFPYDLTVLLESPGRLMRHKTKQPRLP